MTGIFDSWDVTTLIGTYGTTFAVIGSSLLTIAGLFIAKGGYRWVLSMLEKGIHFGGK